MGLAADYLVTTPDRASSPDRRSQLWHVSPDRATHSCGTCLPTVPLPTVPVHPAAGLSRVTRRLGSVSVSIEAVPGWPALSLRRAWFGSPTGSRRSKTPGVPP